MKEIFTGKIDGREISEGSIVLIKVPSKKLIEMNTNVLKWYVSKKGYGVVYITVNKPFATLIENFKKAKIDTGRIFVIDAVTPRKVFEGAREENAVFIGSPKELTNISIATTSALSKLSTAKILICDSVSTLLFYNGFEVVKDFIHFIAQKVKSLKVTFAMICIKDMTDEKMISQLSAFADEVIEIKD